MRLYEIASAEDQLALLRQIIDNTWTAISHQADQERRAAAQQKPKAASSPSPPKPPTVPKQPAVNLGQLGPHNPNSPSSLPSGSQTRSSSRSSIIQTAPTNGSYDSKGRPMDKTYGAAAKLKSGTGVHSKMGMR